MAHALLRRADRELYPATGDRRRRGGDGDREPPTTCPRISVCVSSDGRPDVRPRQKTPDAVSGVVGEEPLTALPAQLPGVDHLAQERRRAVLVVSQVALQDLHD